MKILSKLFIYLIIAFSAVLTPLQAADSSYVSPFAEQNSNCFKCHGNTHFKYFNDNYSREISHAMYEELRIDSNLFYQSNHKSFSCVDCHSSDLETYPHPAEAKGEEYYMCIDCHGYDEQYAQYHFEEIEEEYNLSTHANANTNNFTCWSCHDPHTYKINARTNKSVINTVAYDNAICLKCHSNFDEFMLLSDRDKIDILKTHDWLPNQELHFKNVRCIECHTKIQDSILIAHQIMPKDSAVSNCAECHSTNSRLMATLYKFETKERKNSLGFFNGVLMENSFVIGANRNYFLNVISISAYCLVILIVIGHIILRILTRNK